jgi:hypothetical protein
LKPKQLVFATGAYGPPNIIPLPGIESFAGEHFHSCRYETGEPYAGKNCIVVGADSSANDIAADLWENVAHVTMLQRSPTTVVRSETLMELGFEPLYSESALKAGITTDKADLLFASTPFRMMHRGQIPIYEEVRRRDAPFYARLAKSGFKVDFGEDESGLMMKAMRTGSGYYIDVGAFGSHRKGQHRGEKRDRNPARQGALRRTYRRIRTRRGPDRDGDRLPVNAHWRSLFRKKSQTKWASAGPRLGRPERPGPVGRRAAQHVEAHSAARSVVPRRQSRSFPAFLVGPCASDQGMHAGTADASLRAAPCTPHALTTNARVHSRK